jgi:flagellar biosynthesis/type III secretory pathway protein FliH
MKQSIVGNTRTVHFDGLGNVRFEVDENGNAVLPADAFASIAYTMGSILMEAKREAHKEGYEEGQQDAAGVGRDEGYEDGFDAGYEACQSAIEVANRIAKEKADRDQRFNRVRNKAKGKRRK